MPHAIDPDPIMAACIFVSRLSNYFPRCSVAVFRMYFPPFVFLQSTSVCLHGPAGENKIGIWSQNTPGRLLRILLKQDTALLSRVRVLVR